MVSNSPMQYCHYVKVIHSWIAIVTFCALSFVAGAGCALVGPGERATAELKDKDGKTIGMASFVEVGDGVRVRVEVKGLSAGLHAVHIHAVGKCDAPAFTSAGGHFNPAQKKHGYRSPDGAHAGDLPNMLVAKDGAGRFEALTDAVTLGPGQTQSLTPMAVPWSYMPALTMTLPIRRETPVIALPAV